MQIVTLSGKVCGPCELRKDIRGHEYIRFKVSCASKDGADGYRYTVYRCYSFDTAFRDLQKGDLVFLLGDLNVITTTDENGKTWFNLDVYVKNIER